MFAMDSLGRSSPKRTARVVRETTGLPWAVYLKRRFHAKRYTGGQHCVCLAISKAMAKHLAEIFNEELEGARAMARAARKERRG